MKSSANNIICGIIDRLTSAMGLDCQVSVSDPSDEGVVTVNISTESDAKLLIGKNGQNLSAIEHVVRAALYRNTDMNNRVVVDVNDYRQERAGQVISMVRQIVSRVRDTRKPHTLSPMTPHERRLVHVELTSYTDVTSESVGENENRRVVIKPLSF